MTANDVIGKTCPYCQTPIKPGAPVVICSVCAMPHHDECWQENRGCTTFGCAGAAQAGAPSPSSGAASPQTSQGNRYCAVCGYFMSALDTTCIRCANMRRQGIALPIAGGAPPPVYPPPPPPSYPPRVHMYGTAPYQSYPPYQQVWNGMPLPPHLNTWNWGAFGCSLFWAAAMNRWGWFCVLLFLGCIPGVGLFGAIYLGIQGNSLAWTSRQWQSVEHFAVVQNVWKAWGIGLTVLSGIMILIMIFVQLLAAAMRANGS